MPVYSTGIFYIWFSFSFFTSFFSFTYLFKTKFINCETERSHSSARIFISLSISPSMVMLTFSFNGFIYNHPFEYIIP